MAAVSLTEKFLAHPSFAGAVRGPLQFFMLEPAKRHMAEEQLARTGTIDMVDYSYVASHLLDQKRAAIGELRQFVELQRDNHEVDVLRRWLSRREAEVTLIDAAATLHDSVDDSAAVAAFNLACDELYGAYEPAQFFNHLQLLLNVASETKGTHWEYLAERLPLAAIATQAKAVHEPTKSDIQYYQRLGRQEFAVINDIVERRVAPDQVAHDSNQLQDMITELLHHIGAVGWKVLQSDATTKIGVNYAHKTIFIRKGPFRMMPYRLRGLLAHEVYVHVRRKLTTTPMQQLEAQCSARDQAFEEGLGVFAEQVFLPRFQHLRQFRYIAIGLAKGVAGTPRAFAEVYEIIWRLKLLTQQTGDEQTARHYAFDETSRVFRGLPLHIGGAAFTKDKLYIEGNAEVWSHLSFRLSPEKFADFLLKR